MKRRVLIVDDDPGVFGLVVQCLGESLYEFIFALSAGEALDKLQADRDIELILADFYGPEHTDLAMELVPRVRQLGFKAPIIVMSQLNPNRSEVATAVRKGADYYLEKADFVSRPDSVKLTVEDALLPTRHHAAVEDQFPLPIAFLYRDVARNFVDSRRRLYRVLDLFDVWLRFVCFLTIAAAPPSYLISSDLLQPSLGHWIRELLAIGPRLQSQFFSQELADLASAPQVREALNGLREIRNDVAHGGTPSESALSLLMERAWELVQLLIDHSSFLGHGELFVAGAQRNHRNGIEYQVRLLRGSNPAPLQELRATSEDLRLLDGHVYFADRRWLQFVDLFPYIMFGAEGASPYESLFLYRKLRQNKIQAEDFVYGQRITTPLGVKEILGRLSPRRSL